MTTFTATAELEPGSDIRKVMLEIKAANSALAEYIAARALHLMGFGPATYELDIRVAK